LKNIGRWHYLFFELLNPWIFHVYPKEKSVSRYPNKNLIVKMRPLKKFSSFWSSTDGERNFVKIHKLISAFIVMFANYTCNLLFWHKTSKHYYFINYKPLRSIPLLSLQSTNNWANYSLKILKASSWKLSGLIKRMTN